MKKAFTLAEVLITLGIIGIVAAMTLPAVVTNIQDKQFKSAFKKQYSAFSQAMQKAYMEEGQAYSKINWKQMPKYFCRIQTEMKVVKSGIICPKDIDSMAYLDGTGVGGVEFGGSTDEWPKSGQVYWHKSGSWYDKTGKPMNFNNLYKPLSFLLPDGGLVLYNCSNQIFIDVNGYQKPNTVGRDIFYFILKDSQTLPSFFENNGSVNVNSCAGSLGIGFTKTIKKDNYKDDCMNGSGWGCSPLYILD